MPKGNAVAMDIRQVEAFQAVMTYGTTARAAEVLGLSQPAVSKAISALERSIEFKLFDREKGRLVPTAEGQLYFREVQAAFVGIAKLRSAAARIRDYGSGDIRVGSRSALSTSFVPAAVNAFKKKAPGVAITLHVASSSTIRDMVAANQVDIALVADEVDVSGVEAVKFNDAPAVVALPPEHPLVLRDVIAPSDLQNVDFISLAPEDTTRRDVEALFAKHNVTPKVVAETSYSATICALALGGAGCGIVHPFATIGFVERGLVTRPMVPSVIIRTLLLFPPRQKSELVKLMQDCFEEQNVREA